jgi:hypothetical protein
LVVCLDGPDDWTIEENDQWPEKQIGYANKDSSAITEVPRVLRLVHLANTARQRVGWIEVVHFIACVGLADPAEFVLADGTGHVIAALDALDLSLADWAKYDSFDFKFLA